MRTTVRIDDDLLRALKERARHEKTTLTRIVNVLLRRGISASGEANRRKRPYREKTFSMGCPQVDMTKALLLAAQLEDEETIKLFKLDR
jgi:hypothetical protein